MCVCVCVCVCFFFFHVFGWMVKEFDGEDDWENLKYKGEEQKRFGLCGEFGKPTTLWVGGVLGMEVSDRDFGGD